MLTPEQRVIRAVKHSQRKGMTSEMIFRAVEKQLPSQISWEEVEAILRVLVSCRTLIVYSRRFRFRG